MPRAFTASQKLALNKGRKLDVLTPEDYALFELGKTNANYISDYYMRAPRSGTYHRHNNVPFDPEREEMWQAINAEWLKAGSPTKDFEAYGNEYSVSISRSFPEFFHNHGWLFQPWQLLAHHTPIPDITIIGGMGSLDIDARVYEADLQEYVTFRWMIQNHHSPTVLSKTPEGWAKVKASAPYYEGRETLYRVRTEAGKSIDVTAGHRFLTSRGYVHTRDLIPGDRIVSPDTLPAKLHDAIADVQHRSQIMQDYQDGCSGHCRQCDEQPRVVQEADQSSAPSRDDVQKSSHSPFCDHHNRLALEPQCTDPQMVGLTYRLTKQDSALPSVILAEPGLPVRDLQAIDALARPVRADQALSEYGKTTNQYWKDVLESPSIDLGVMASFSSEHGLIEWKYSAAYKLTKGQPDQRQDDPQLTLAYQTLRSTHPSLPESTNSNPGLCDDSQSLNLPEHDNQWWNYTALDAIVSVEPIGARDFYDIHVPVYNNYVAEGVVNHNTGKTALIATSLCIMAMTIPHFRGFAIAPQTIQCMEVYNYIVQNFADTPFWDRFVWESPKSPHPVIRLRGDFIGESTIEMYAIEHDTKKIRTLEGDAVFLDQAEKIDDLDELSRDAGSRLRGTIQGRNKLGKMFWIANSGDNPALWMRYDMAEFDPEHYLSLNPTTEENIYLTKYDRDNLRRRIIAMNGSEENVDELMHASRPLGKGEQFSRKLVTEATDRGLNNVMNSYLAMEPDRRPAGYAQEQLPICSTYLWQMPPDFDAKRRYIVIGDPGQGNPPDRNSGCVQVWDVTDFPKKPMVMRAFSWVFGNGSYMPFLTQFSDWTREYRAQGQNAFDSTGVQKGFDELYFEVEGIFAEGLDASGTGKFLAINAAKMFLGKHLMRFPYIPHLVNQLTNYRLPDTKIKQDLVMTFCMAAYYARRYFWEESEEDDELEATELGVISRYSRNAIDRYDRKRANR